MSARVTWIPAKMHFPSDVDPADIDWVEPLNPSSKACLMPDAVTVTRECEHRVNT